jgi:hypothetical protein
MKISGDSIVDTIIEYANIKFGVDMSEKQVSQQLKSINLSSTLDLLDAIKDEDDGKFLDHIDISVEEGYGSAGTPTPSRATNRSMVNTERNAARRANNAVIDVARDSTGVQRKVAGGNKTSTGAPAQTDPAAAQRDSNSQATQKIQSELERMKQVVKKMEQR